MILRIAPHVWFTSMIGFLPARIHLFLLCSLRHKTLRFHPPPYKKLQQLATSDDTLRQVWKNSGS